MEPWPREASHGTLEHVSTGQEISGFREKKSGEADRSESHEKNKEVRKNEILIEEQGPKSLIYLEKAIFLQIYEGPFT